MTYTTIEKIMKRDKWAVPSIDPCLHGFCKFAVYDDRTGKIYMSKLLYELFYENKELMSKNIQVIDLSDVGLVSL